MDYAMYMDCKAIYDEERRNSIYTGFLESYPSSHRLNMLMNSLTGHEVMILSKTTINSSKSDILEYIQILQRVVENIPDNTFPWTVPPYRSYWKAPIPTNNNPQYGQNRQYQPLNQTADNINDLYYYTGSEEPKVISDSFAKKLENDLPDKVNVNPSYDDHLLNQYGDKADAFTEPQKSDAVEHDNAVEPDYSETQRILSDKQRLNATNANNTVNGRNPWGVQSNQNNQTVKIGIDDSGKNVVLPNPECGNILTANIPNTPQISKQISEIVESNIPNLSPFKQIGSPGNLLDILSLNENE